MIQQSKAKIFLADQRGLDETAAFRSRQTFNFGKYYNEHKQAFADIYLFNEDTLAGNGAVNMQVNDTSYIILIPVAGAIECTNTTGQQHLAAAGQFVFMTANAGDTIAIRNPFSDDLVSFLQIWIRSNTSEEDQITFVDTYPDLNEDLNSMVSLASQSHFAAATSFQISLGKFSGRGETVYHTKNNKAGIFIFVVAGAFEVEGRLLHAGDGLALWDVSNAEMEALSNDAIILVIEV